MCPHPFASPDCAAVFALLAAPGAMVALIFAISLLIRWRPARAARSRTTRWLLMIVGAVPTSFVASVLVSWVFLRLDVYRSGHDERGLLIALLALTVGLESAYVLACRRGLTA